MEIWCHAWFVMPIFCCSVPRLIFLRSFVFTGTFTALYKFLINALPILIPAIKPRRITSSQSESALDDTDEETEPFNLAATGIQAHHEVPLDKRKARLSLSTHAQLLLIRKQTRRWHAAFAGAVAGGLAILWETRNRRGVIAQQMFVR